MAQNIDEFETYFQNYIKTHSWIKIETEEQKQVNRGTVQVPQYFIKFLIPARKTLFFTNQYTFYTPRGYSTESATVKIVDTYRNTVEEHTIKSEYGLDNFLNQHLPKEPTVENTITTLENPVGMHNVNILIDAQLRVWKKDIERLLQQCAPQQVEPSIIHSLIESKFLQTLRSTKMRNAITMQCLHALQARISTLERRRSLLD